MKVYIYLYILLIISVSDYKMIIARSSYDNPSYNSDRDENLSSATSHQKKRLASDDAFHENQNENFERSAPVYEAQRFRKYDPESFARRNQELNENKMQKRDFYDSSNAKDASIEVILDPRAKKAVAVVENSPTGQAMYDLTAWKNKDENFDSDQYSPGSQDQVVNLVYPMERNERKYTNLDLNSDYSDKKTGFKNKELNEDSRKRKRNAETKKSEKDTEKRNAQEKTKRKTSDEASQTKSDPKQSSIECPPHNTPSAESENKEKENKEEKTVKRETSQWTQEQLDALKNSLAHVKDSSGEVQNLRNILSNMGLIDSSPEVKREASKEDKEKREDVNSESKSDSEDEDLNQDNIILKRSNRNTDEDVIKSEAVEKRETNLEGERNVSEEKKDTKRADTEEKANKSELQSRKKRQDSETAQKEEKSNENPVEMEADKAEKYTKRETNSDNQRELRKNREDKETEEEYERRMESQIQAKIDAIKEKVKREIMAEQAKRNTRKKRQSKEEENEENVRRKRANILPEKQMVYQAYQQDQDEENEDGEFDDNAYDGKMYVEKRQAEEESDYYDPVRKREVETYLRQYYPESRNRRSFENNFAEDSNAFHGSRRVLKNKNYIDAQEAMNENSEENNENSDSEYFGSLPQNSNGELMRYKRVKRDDPYK